MWVLVDLSYLAHRARHALKDLVSEDMPTGVLYGFFEQLYSVCALPRFSSSKVLIFADSRHSYRSRTFPGYKAKRAADRSEEEWEQIRIMHQQINILRRKALPTIGFPVYGQKGLESDDLIAWMAQELTRRKQVGVIITSDGDLFQCITPQVSWYDPQRELYLSQKNFWIHKGVHPEEWGMVKAIGGCTTDNVPGIRGVSEQGAIDYLCGRIPTHYKKYQSIIDAEANGELDKWKELVVLPHKKTRPLKLRVPQYNPEAFFSFCEEHDIDSYLEGAWRKRWEKFFKGRFPGAPRKRRRLVG